MASLEENVEWVKQGCQAEKEFFRSNGAIPGRIAVPEHSWVGVPS